MRPLSLRARVLPCFIQTDCLCSGFMIECCKRMLENEFVLSRYLHGLTLRVSDHFGVDPVDGTLTVKWDWL